MHNCCVGEKARTRNWCLSCLVLRACQPPCLCPYSLLILMIECCISSVISVNSSIIGRNDQWSEYWRNDLLLVAVASISLSVRKFTTYEFSNAASFAPSSSAQPSISNCSKRLGIATWKKYPEDSVCLEEESMKTPISVWLWRGSCCTHNQALHNTLGPLEQLQ